MKQKEQKEHIQLHLLQMELSNLKKQLIHQP